MLSAPLVTAQHDPRQGTPPGSTVPGVSTRQALGRPNRNIGTIRALTPAHGHLRRQVSPLTSPHLPDVPPPTTRCVPTALSTPAQRVGCVSGFALSQEARHALPAESGSSPADRQFASGCSPPRLAATQLPSATEPWHTPTRTCTVLMRRPHGRTRSAALGAIGPLRRHSAGGRVAAGRRADHAGNGHAMRVSLLALARGAHASMTAHDPRPKLQEPDP